MLGRKHKKTRIIIEASSLSEERMSGIGHSIHELVRTLTQHPDYNKYFIVELALSFDKTQQVRNRFPDLKLRLFPIPMRLFNILWKFDVLPPMDLYFGKGVYVFPNYKNWRLLLSPSITYVHDISFVLYPKFVAPKNQTFLEKNLPKWMDRTSLVATDSKSAQSEISDYYKIPKEKIPVFYHGVNTNFFYKRSAKEVEHVKSKYGIEGKYILYLGNIEPRKNLVNLVEAYKQLPEKLRNTYELVFAGGLGWLNEPIYESIKQAKATGFNTTKLEKYVLDEDLPALHSGAAILVLPSHYEGFGLSLVQAMACETPVLAGNNSSMKEIVADNGLLVDVDDTKAIRDNIEKLLTDNALRRSLVRKGLLRAKEFNWNKTTDKIVQAARKLNGARK